MPLARTQSGLPVDGDRDIDVELFVCRIALFTPLRCLSHRPRIPLTGHMSASLLAFGLFYPIGFGPSRLVLFL